MVLNNALPQQLPESFSVLSLHCTIGETEAQERRRLVLARGLLDQEALLRFPSPKLQFNSCRKRALDLSPTADPSRCERSGYGFLFLTLLEASPSSQTLFSVAGHTPLPPAIP